MPLRPATPVPLILVRAYVLTRQETGYLLRTGGITAVPTLYGALYPRPRSASRRLVGIPEDAQVRDRFSGDRVTPGGGTSCGTGRAVRYAGMTCDSPPKNTGFLRTQRLRAVGAVGVLLAAALLTGCGQDSGDTSTGTDTSEAARAVPERTTTPSNSANTSASPSASMTKDQQDRKKLLDSTKITFDKAVTTAEGAVSGGKVVDLDLRGPGKSDDDTDRESASPSASASPSGSSASPSGSASASPTATGASPSDASASPAATGPEWVATVAAKDGTEHTVRIDAVSGKVVKSTEDSDQDSEDKSRTADWVAKAKQTPQKAAKAAMDKKKGTVTSLELDENDKNVLVWSVDVVDKSWNETTVDVDAATGSVTAQKTDTD